jgi:hypothetical protein
MLKSDLANIQANLNFLSQYVTKLKKIKNLSKTIKEISVIQGKLNEIKGPKPAVEQKFCVVWNTHILTLP